MTELEEKLHNTRIEYSLPINYSGVIKINTPPFDSYFKNMVYILDGIKYTKIDEMRLIHEFFIENSSRFENRIVYHGMVKQKVRKKKWEINRYVVFDMPLEIIKIK